MNPLKDRPLRLLSALFLVALACSFAGPSFAQVYPVHVTTQLQGPYTPYLSDYTTPGSQKLLVQLRVNDPTLAEYRCKLRVTIEGVGITLRTKQGFIPDPIVLSGGGIPEIFYGADLASYFDPANLDFAGFSRSEFNQSARLPEGIYRFTIEVLDYNKNIVVSNAGTAMAWIILNDPPILNLPRNETKLQLIDPANIVFTWTPRHKGSPNAALSTEYIFRLVEIWPASRNPYDAFLSQPPLYETTTDMQQLLYGPAEPALIPGRRYAWQVQAVDIEKRDLFKNQGRSEVFVFQYGDELTAPENLRLQSANPTNLTVRWDQVTGGTAATNFRVQYREHRNRSSNEWYEAQTTDQWRAIPQLKSDTEYEVQVRAEQQFQASPYTVVQVFRTLTPGTNEFVCRDDASPPPLPSSTTPLFGLAINDTIKAGGYNVLVRSVTGGTGQYSGEGMAIIPYLNGAKVRVTFENIRVNGQNMLTAGIIKSYWNPDSKFMLEVETPTLPGQQPSTGEIPVTVVATETLIEITGAAIATVSKDEDDNIVVHTTDGKQQTLEKGETYSVVDEQGNGYVIDEKGNIAKTSAAEARAAHQRGNRTYNLALTFAKGDGKLGFDDLPLRAPGQFSVLHSHYQQVDGTFIPWKAVTSSAQDAVTVIPDNAEMDLSGIRFEVNGVAVQPQNNAGNISLNLYGKTGGMVEELIAITGDDEQSEVLGKLNLVSYDGITKNVVIVPVNNASLPGSLTSTELSNKLTEIFQQAVTKVQVSIAPNLSVILNDTFDDGESGMLSNYTGDMRKVINTFGNIQDDTYYLFLVDNPASGADSYGVMPRSKQVGFIFANNLANDTHAVRAMAHELGHGFFNLKHTFSEFAIPENSTQNLMDYSFAGTELLKYQWDFVHNPQRVIPLFEGDDDSEYYSKERMLAFLKTLQANNEKYSEKSDPGTGAYLTASVVTEQDLKDQNIIDHISSLSLYQFMPDYTATDPIIQGWLALVKDNPNGAWYNLIDQTPDPVPYDQNPILLAMEMKLETDTKEAFTLSMNGYSLSNKSITLYAQETQQGNDVKLTFFNALIAPSGATNAADQKNTVNIRKAFDITVHSKNPEAFKNYIKLKGAISIVDDNPESEEIIIDVIRKRSNQYITVSELSIRGTNIKGAALELGKGTEAESKLSCTDYRADCFECKRVPAGEYPFDINTETTQQGQHKFKTLRLKDNSIPGSQRTGILIHMGDSYSWTQGCLLAMYDNEIETITANDAMIYESIMGYGLNIDERNAGRVFILSVIEFIEAKEKTLGKRLKKRVIISSDPTEETLNVNTEKFDLLQKVNRYYYSNSLYQKCVAHFSAFITKEHELSIRTKVLPKLQQFADSTIAATKKENLQAEQVRMILSDKLTSIMTTITFDELKKNANTKRTGFLDELKNQFEPIIPSDILSILFVDNRTILNKEILNNFVDTPIGPGFASTNYPATLHEKIISESRDKIVDEQIAKITAAIQQKD